MRRSLLAVCLILAVMLASGVQAAAPKVALVMLMEDVPETRIIETLLPEFEKATGIGVEFEIVQYGDMHAKLVTQFMSPESHYDVIQVDNYWAGEFPAARWLEPLDKYISRDKFDISDYVPSMVDMVGYYDGKLYMLPMYNYAMCIVYRTDLMSDPKLQKAFEAEYKAPMLAPTTVAEYVTLCKFMQKNAGVSGSAMQAQRGDPIVMEWSNYLFSCGGSYYDKSWHSTVNRPEAIKATELYIDNVKHGAPQGALSFNLDDAFRVMSQGRAFSMISYNWMLPQLNDPSKSKVAGKVAIAAMPGGIGLNGGWGWAIAHNGTRKEEAWRFIKWVESQETARKRALLGGAPTKRSMFTDKEVVRNYPWYPQVLDILENARPVPEFQYSAQMIEVMGRELSLAASGQKEIKAALDSAAKELDALARQSKMK
ncbi:MAG: extracellular solute-binding protein [Clostridia bacterium]|nr:extracellular solute-binding protein [Clostridia bacterium]